jgi:hypothetical protein
MPTWIRFILGPPLSTASITTIVSGICGTNDSKVAKAKYCKLKVLSVPPPADPGNVNNETHTIILVEMTEVL